MIREATSEDLPRLEDLARQFYAASKFLFGFQVERFVEAWKRLMDSGSGVVIIDDGAGGIRGAIGGVVYPDLYSGRPIATEFFWFVAPVARSGGVRLYREFEAWARRQGAAELRMVHLADSMPEKLGRIYKAWGFEPVETHYRKELS